MGFKSSITWYLQGPFIFLSLKPSHLFCLSVDQHPSVLCLDQISSYLFLFIPGGDNHCNAGWTWQDSAVLEGFIWQGVSWPHTHYHQTSSPMLPPNQEPLSQEMRRGWLLILSLSPEPLRQEPEIRKWQLVSVN